MSAEGVLQASAMANGNGQELNVAGSGEVGFQITGITSATVGFQGTIDGSNWVPIDAKPVAGGTPATSVAANGIYTANVATLKRIRTPISAFVSGVITVHAFAVTAPGEGTSSGGGGGGGGDASAANQVAILAELSTKVDEGGSVAPKQIVSNTATLTNIPASATSVQLLALNNLRFAAKVVNDVNKTFRGKAGATASATSYTDILSPIDSNGVGGQLVLEGNYLGRYDGISDASPTGFYRTTEWT